MVRFVETYQELSFDELIDWSGGYNSGSGYDGYNDDSDSGSGYDGYDDDPDDDGGKSGYDGYDDDPDDDAGKSGYDGYDDDPDGYEGYGDDDDEEIEDFDQSDWREVWENNDDIPNNGWAYSCYATAHLNQFQHQAGENISKEKAQEIIEEAIERGYIDDGTGEDSRGAGFLHNAGGLWDLAAEKTGNDDLEGQGSMPSNKFDYDPDEHEDHEEAFYDALDEHEDAEGVMIIMDDGHATHLTGDEFSDIHDPFYEDGKYNYDNVQEMRFY